MNLPDVPPLMLDYHDLGGRKRFLSAQESARDLPMAAELAYREVF